MQTENKKLVIAESLMPNTGYGLFARENIQRNENLGEYRGQRIDREEAQRRTSPFIAQLSRDVAIDPAVGGNEMRFINSPAGSGLRTNTRFQRRKKPPRLDVVATKNIHAGQELYLGYGSAYWGRDRPTTGEPATTQQKVEEIKQLKRGVHTARGRRQDDRLTTRNQVASVGGFQALDQRKRKRTDITGYDTAKGLCSLYMWPITK